MSTECAHILWSTARPSTGFIPQQAAAAALWHKRKAGSAARRAMDLIRRDRVADFFPDNPASGKIGYGTPWCAAFVSAVAIKTGNTEVIPVHSYCPSMLSLFAEKTYDKKYTPTGADVIFFDWNRNKVPDHVGMVEKTSGDNVTTIEGNYADAVKRRTFKKGYSLLLAYGLPNYTIRNTVAYTAPTDSEQTADAGTVKTACIEIEDILEDRLHGN